MLRRLEATRIFDATGSLLVGSMRSAYVHGHLSVCFVAAGLSMASFSAALIKPDFGFLLLAAFGAYLAYQLDSEFGGRGEDDINHPGRVRWRRRHRPFVLWSSLGAAAFVVALLGIRFQHVQLLASVIGIVGLAYALPLVPGLRSVKQVWFLKPVAIALGWSMGTVALPLAAAGATAFPSWPWHHAGTGVLVVYRFFFLLPNALASDLPDIRGDQRVGLETPASRMGPRFVLNACYVSAAVAGLMLLLFVRLQLPAGWILVECVGLLLSVGAIHPGGVWPGTRYRYRVDAALVWFFVAWTVYTLVW